MQKLKQKDKTQKLKQKHFFNIFLLYNETTC